MSQNNPPIGGAANAGAANDKLGFPGMDPVKGGGDGPGGESVGVVGIVALTFYLVLFALFIIYCLVVLWPVPTPSGDAKPVTTAAATPTPTPTPRPAGTPTPAPNTTAPGQTPTATPTPTPTPPPTVGTQGGTQPPASPSASPAATPPPDPQTVNFLGWQLKIWDEQRLLLLVLLAGALGSLIHDIRSVYWYIGNRELVKSWLAMYLLLPFAGATLALVFYLVVRGGFFSPKSGFNETSPFGFIALAVLVGMFSPQAVLKLKDVAETMLARPQPGANAAPQQPTPPVAPPAAPRGAPSGPPAGGAG
jgi:hypothetical protein